MSQIFVPEFSSVRVCGVAEDKSGFLWVSLGTLKRKPPNKPKLREASCRLQLGAFWLPLIVHL